MAVSAPKVVQSQLTLTFGDLTTSNADALISSDDYMLKMGGDVSVAIRRAGGEAVLRDVSKKLLFSLSIRMAEVFRCPLLSGKPCLQQS